jgi:hypothetical protein
MYFLVKVALALAIVFMILPEKEADRVSAELKHAVAQDKTVRAAVDRTHLAAQHAVRDAQRLCGPAMDECVDNAKQAVRDAANRW